MASRDLKDIIGGAVFGAIGLAFFIRSFDYGIGTASRMAPGYFSMVLGGAAMAAAVAIIVPAFRRPGSLPKIAWRPLLAVAAAIVAFIISLRSLGLVPAIMLTTMVAGVGDREFTWRGLILLAIFAAFMAWLIFSVGLGISVPVITGVL